MINEWDYQSAVFTKGSKWLRSQEVWSFTPQQSCYQQQVQDLLCASSFYTLIMKLMFQHPSGKGKYIWGSVLVIWAALFSFSVEISSLHLALLRYHKITVHCCEELRDLHWTLNKNMDMDEKHLSKSGYCFSWGEWGGVEPKGFLSLEGFFSHWTKL